ncbi:3-oxoacyl-ACP reductase FabG [Hydrogenovibrio halophilus]|uniref:3-oxoacyl-ACP reductase FabG n=1 Tax=Hydrogenovibrio halophilus TaxID=373391 RepID=UPI00037F4B1E|nr:3-oxoacyl-ACP reductase FabG [Hydrogenovibrio halophilus]
MTQEKKRALITGASGDLGQAIARELVEQGFFVYLHANRRLENAQALAQTLNTENGATLAEAIAFDLTDAEATQSGVETLLEAGPIQVLVNNAGLHDDAPMAGMSAEQWHTVMDVSLNGFFHVTHPLLLPMIRTRWGRIINIASIAGITGNRGQTNYAAAKAGLIGATKSLALELASRGITVNAIAPGIIEGDMSEDAFPPEQTKALVPMKRAGKPEDVAHMVGFLTSDKSHYITRQVFQINGGMA